MTAWQWSISFCTSFWRASSERFLAHCNAASWSSTWSLKVRFPRSIFINLNKKRSHKFMPGAVRALKDSRNVPRFEELLDSARTMLSSVVPLPQDFVQVNRLRPQHSSQVTGVANEINDPLGVNSFSRRHCRDRKSLAWSKSNQEHDFFRGDLATGDLWTRLVLLQPAPVLLFRWKHLQVKPSLILHDKLVAERIHAFGEEETTNMLCTVHASFFVNVSQVVRDPN